MPFTIRNVPLAFLAFFAACSSPAAMQPKPADTPIPISSASGENTPQEPKADPICGPDWRWDGNRCARSEGAHDATSTPTTSHGGPGAGGAPKLGIVDVVVGNGAEAKPGDTISVHYTGSLADGTKFDSSRDRGKPFEFTLGAAQVIKGFERGVVGMKVGGQRTLTIPPELGYGKRGAPPAIPPKATLVFEIELLGIK